MDGPLRIATRSSNLARWQAKHVAGLLRPVVAPRVVELVLVRTTGDVVADAPLTVIGGIGVFTKEVQQAVLDERADLAVHSLKDLPTFPTPGLVLAAVPPRGPIADVLIAPGVRRFDDLPQGARVATGSSRRRAQILRRRPDLRLVQIRGNVETRVRKVRDEGIDGLILAQAGLERLGLESEISDVLDPSWMLPAVGQGALGVECREDDGELRELLKTISDPVTYRSVTAERAFLRGLGGGCLLPIAAWATVAGGQLTLDGAVYSPDGRECLRGARSGPAEAAESMGQTLADQLLAQGARALLDRPGFRPDAIL